MRCYLPWTQAFVNANGITSPCCAPLDMGNMAERPLGELFTGGSYQRLRTDLAAGHRTESTRHCDNCYAIRKLAEGNCTFDVAYGLGADTQAALDGMAQTHPRFVENYRLVRACYVEGRPLPPTAMPLKLEIQLGEHCDIRCIMCWQDHTRPRALKPEDFEQIGQMLPYVVSVLFTGGEPTIFKSFWRLVDLFKTTAQPFAKLDVLTHGQHLKDTIHRFDGIKNLNLAINVDGPTRETYETIRKGASWDKLTASLAAVAEARRDRPGWQLNTTFLLMRSNIDLIAESFDLAERYGAAWACGMIAGEHSPADQCRTYLEENIFRFSQEGYNPDEIIARLAAALPRAATHPYPLAKAQLEATIQQVRATRQLAVTPAARDALRRISDAHELSRTLQQIVLDDIRSAQGSTDDLRDELLHIESIHGGHSSLRAAYGLRFGIQLIAQGDLDRARSELTNVLNSLVQLNDADPSDMAMAQYHLGRCLLLQGSDEALPLLIKAWKALGEQLGARSTRTAEAALELGKAFNQAGQFDRAVEPLEQAWRVFRDLYGKQQNSSYVAVAGSELGRAYVETHRPAEAELPLRSAIGIYRALWGEDSAHTATAMHMLARGLIATNRFDDADALLQPYLVSLTAKLGEGHMLSMLTHGFLVNSRATRAGVNTEVPPKFSLLRRVFRRSIAFWHGASGRIGAR